MSKKPLTTNVNGIIKVVNTSFILDFPIYIK